MLSNKIKNCILVTRPPIIIGCLVMYYTYILYNFNNLLYYHYIRGLSLLITVAFGNIFNNYIDYDMDKEYKKDSNLLWDRNCLTKFDYILLVTVFFSLCFVINTCLLLTPEYSKLGFIGCFELFSAFSYSYYFKNTKFKNLLFLIILVVPMFLEGTLLHYDLTLNLSYNISIILFYFPREIIIDINDYDGDLEYGLRTIPILFGKQSSLYIAYSFHLLWISFRYILLNNSIIDNDQFGFDVITFIMFSYLYLKHNKNTPIQKKLHSCENNMIDYGYNLKKVYGTYFLKNLLDCLINPNLSLCIHMFLLFLFV